MNKHTGEEEEEEEKLLRLKGQFTENPAQPSHRFVDGESGEVF